MEVEEIKGDLVIPLGGYQVYAFSGTMHLFL